MGFHVLSGTSQATVAAWLQQWRRWPRRQVFAHPSFVALFARPQDEAVCLSYIAEDSGILFPLILRELNAEPWTDNPGRDATTAYGYGGPYGWNVSQTNAASFWAAVRDWADKVDLLSLFCRLPLFSEDNFDFPFPTTTRSPNVVRNLAPAPEDIWRDYAPKVRKNVNRAVRAGLTVEQDPDGRRLDEFKFIYRETMRRTGAGPQYLFSDSFFDDLIDKLRDHVHLCHTIDGDKVVASEILLLSQHEAYSFLGGTRSDAFSNRPNEILKHEAFLWARAEGKSKFVLGGGLANDDGIHRYKRAFAPNSEIAFRTGSITVLEERCQHLVTQRKTWAAAQGRPWQPITGYFPPYRSPNQG